MRRIAGFFLLLFSRLIFGCDAPHGFPLADIRYVPDCGFSQAALAVSDDGAFAAWHWTHFGFGLIGGTNYGAPLDAGGRARTSEEMPYDGGTALPAVASDGHDFLLVLSDSASTTAMIVHADGSAEASQKIASNHAAGKSLVVWTGSDYLAVTPDLVAKVTGQAKYAEDFKADGMLFAKLLLSPYPHARVKNIDASKALAMPGVKGILTADELPAPADVVTDLGQRIAANTKGERALASEPVYQGEPVHAIVEDSLTMLRQCGLPRAADTLTRRTGLH